MKCKRDGCSNEVSGRAIWCGDKCRMSHARANSQPEHEQPQPEQINPNTEPEQIVGSVKCYGRPAVVCSQFKTRPKPLDSTDIPVVDNRGRYVRPDGSVYQFDFCGNSFDCKHEYIGLDGKKHLAVYASTKDVQACYV